MEVLNQTCFICEKFYKDIGLSFTSRMYKKDETEQYTSCQMYDIQKIVDKKLLHIVNVSDIKDHLCSFCFYHCSICNLKYDNLQNNTSPRYLINYENRNIIACSDCFMIKYVMGRIKKSNISINEKLLKYEKKFDMISKREKILTEQINKEFKNNKEKLVKVSTKYDETFQNYDDNFKKCVTNFNTNHKKIESISSSNNESDKKMKFITSFINNHDNILNGREKKFINKLSHLDTNINQLNESYTESDKQISDIKEKVKQNEDNLLQKLVKITNKQNINFNIEIQNLQENYKKLSTQIKYTVIAFAVTNLFFFVNDFFY